MAKPKEKGASRKGGRKISREELQSATRAFSQKNLLLFLVALIVIIIGHVSLGMGSITFAPVCLVLGYCILVPLAIII
ncbi:MAG: hypothetical protein DRP79_09635 [Planctomycetota bacterium]|nr:MAG: hypothetical protein DRP79_09635 [Planctomycetota bacterium]